MSLEKIKKSILEEAKKEADHIFHESQRKKASVQAEAEENAQKEYQKRIEEEKDTLARDEERFRLECRALTSSEILRLKNRLLDEVFEKAAEEIARLDDRRYHDFIAKYLQAHLSNIFHTIVIGPQDRKRISNDWISKIARSAKQPVKHNSHFNIIISHDISGGFILKGDKIEIDCSLKQLLDDKKEELKLRISQALFGNNC
jgi:V/A-type H+-transporting ATPase subunit E